MQAPGAGSGGGNLNALYMHDAGGNVGQLVAWTANFGGAAGNAWDACRLVARYEYDPYGRIANQAGFYATDNPFRWSTKRFDPETGLSDFGMRYYSATLGRWINRDPIGDLGGANVYAYVANNPTNRVDYRGLKAVVCPYLDTDPSRCGPQGETPPDGARGHTGGQEENDRKPCRKKPEEDDSRSGSRQNDIDTPLVRVGDFTNADCRAACDQITNSKAIRKACYEICRLLKGKTCNQLYSFCLHLGRAKSRLAETCMLLFNGMCSGK